MIKAWRATTADHVKQFGPDGVRSPLAEGQTFLRSLGHKLRELPLELQNELEPGPLFPYSRTPYYRVWPRIPVARNSSRWLYSNIDVLDATLRDRQCNAVFLHAVQVENDRFLDFLFYFLDCSAGRNAAGEIRNVSAEIVLRFLDDDCITHKCYFQPACLNMLF